MAQPQCKIIDVDGATLDIAAALLGRFFVEEGFSVASGSIAENTRRMLIDPHHWIGLARIAGEAVGVVTMSTTLYIEWGRLAEIGDLYVQPPARRSGVGAALIGAAKSKSRALGCSAISVTVTAEGDLRHSLSEFYKSFGFSSSGRNILSHAL
jgi:GNAT superfamily N-acetyltransferase